MTIIKMHPTLPDDDEDITDDPLLSAISADLERANRQTDNNLFLALAAIVSILFLTEQLSGKNSWFAGLAVVMVIGAIAYTIYSVVRRKANVAAKYGLVCPACRHRPSAQMILAAAATHRCGKCGTQLNGSQETHIE